MKEHDRTTTKRIQDNRLRVSLLKNTKILIPVHIISQEVFPQLLQVSRLLLHGECMRASQAEALDFWNKKIAAKFAAI